MLEQRSVLSNYNVSGRTLTGYAAVWDSPARVDQGGRSFTEVIRRGAFRGAVESKADIIATFNHDVNRLLGRTSSGTLRLHEDDRGLRFEIDLPDHANDIQEMVSRGDLNGASFTFRAKRGGDNWKGDVREVTDAFLHELGPVVSPVYSATSLAMRSKLPLMKMRLDLASRF